MKRLLIIRFSALGDVAMLVPVVRELATQYPEWEITVLSQQRMADLFAGMPGNVVFKGVDFRQQSLRETAAGLGRYDMVADMHGVWRSAYIRIGLFLRGARVKSIHKGRFSKFLLTHRILHKPLKHNTLRYIDVLQRLGFCRIAMHTPPVRPGEGIGIAPFAAHRGKMYPLEEMERVVAILSRQGERVVLFGGGKEEAEILDRWAEKYKGAESVAGKYSLAEEIERMSSLRVMVSMDSANMHLASLAGTRVVSIWGATHPYAGFLGAGQEEKDCVQRDLPCRPCSVYGKKKCRYNDYRCLQISPEEITKLLI